MTFILQVQVDTDNEEADLFSIANSDRTKWKVISGNPARQQSNPVQAGGMTSGGIVAGSQFQRTTTTPVPATS